jgi:Trk-type K+ transport system membrane component
MANQIKANLSFQLQTAGLAMALAHKGLIIVAMILGKVETLTILTVLVPIAIKKVKRKTLA